MITLKSSRDIEKMHLAGEIAAYARALAGEMVKPGVSTRSIDKAVHEFIISRGAAPSFLNYDGFPASVCISINEQVIHGIPGGRKIKKGDLVSIDVGAYIEGFHGDCAASFIAGEADDRKRKLIDITHRSFFEGLKFARAGYRVPDISHAIQTYIESNGYSVVKEFVGHGIGALLHEEPEVPNYGKPGHGVRLIPGMTLAIEPMVNLGGPDIRVLSDGWTVVTADGEPSAHYENTVLITSGDPVLLTTIDGDDSDGT